MTQQPENKTISLESILKILRIQADQMPPSPTSSRYRTALASLESSLFTLHSSDSRQAAENDGTAVFYRRPESDGNHSSDSRQAAGNDGTAVFYRRPESDGNLCEDSVLKTEDLRLKTAITDWLVSLWLTGTPFTTASLYLDIISSLYGSAVRAGQLPKTDLFKQLKIALKSLGQQGWTGGIDDEIFERALRLTKNAACLIADDAIAADIVLLSLTGTLQPLEQLALLKREDLFPQSAEGLSQCENTAEPILRSRYSEADTHNAILSIIHNNLSLRNARRRYLFPLDQSRRTPAQLKKHISKIINALFKRARLPQATDPYQTVEALWAYAALRTGVPASALVAYLNYLHPGLAPLGLPVLKLSVLSRQSSESGQAADESSVFSLQPSESGQAADESSVFSLQPSESGQAAGNDGTAVFYRRPESEGNLREDSVLKTEDLRLKTIGTVFLENPPRWYALSLRPGVRFTQLCRRLELLLKTEDSRLKTLKDIQLFYPCEEIARAIGKKIVVRERPFIRSVVFFQAKLTDIGRLFARIGDLAWCYRQSARPGAPYAEISQAQFRLFQQTIARFTPDYEVAPIGELEPRPNDRVQILGGLFAGHEATFEGKVATLGSCVRPEPAKGNLSEDLRLKTKDSVLKTEDSRLKTENTIYRLNIIGDNGFDWRIRVDSRLLKP